ncbi:hypothetical protein N8T08_003906 [Aspergillus melleus]|uniref:Uncharacterized protein n=1 Tax=Aspergillus melleus TaxID=138277 RepID=A0ACC3B5X6_9EURO|nr:hypothetical protein N8T08_003906 [Aspergillus melleus]
MACHLRFQNPDVNMLLQRVHTELDASVISALIEAALRLLPPDNSPKGRAEAKDKMQQKQKQALLQETYFIGQIRGLGYRFQTEKEQQEARQSSTPDIRFLEPISVNGNLCHWIEYKNYFGFKANPFITSKNRKQYRNYASRFGPGAVVYKLGFEVEHVSINGIESFREAEFLYILGQQSELKGSPLG